MYLQKLEIQGFKSFANKTALEFKPGVTAIVGPNGSGKSNIAEAVRWVLGEQSLKALRGKKSGDVIFAGSDKKSRLGFCQVDLFLNNEDHKAPVDYPEIVISRKIYRDGEGEYYINKNKVRLQDILMLLAKSSFGQRSYSIIGQGMVDTFLNVSPKERKEYFDEAVGVRQYQIKKEQAENKLGGTKENLKQAEILVQEIEPRLRSLTRQVKKLERREEVEKELKGIQNEYYIGLWYDLKEKLKNQQNNFKQTEDTRLKIEKEVQVAQKTMQDYSVGSTRQDVFQDLQKEYDQIQNEKNKLLKEQAVVKGRLEIEKEQKGGLDFVWLEKKSEQLGEDIKNHDEELRAVNNTLKKHQEALNTQQGEYQEIIGQYQEIEKKLQSTREELSSQKTMAVPEIAKEVTNIYNQQKSLLDKIEAAQSPDDLQNLKAEAKVITSNLAQLNHKLDKAGGGDPQNIIKLQDSLSAMLSNKEELLNKISDTKTNIRVAEEQVKNHHQAKSNQTAEKEKIDQDLDRIKSSKGVSELKLDAEQENKQIEEKINNISDKLSEISEKLNHFNSEEQNKKEEIFSLQRQLSQKQSDLTGAASKVNEVKIELAKIDTKREDLEKEMIDELTDEERDTIYHAKEPATPKPQLFSEIQKLKRNLELIGGIDPQVSEEYEQTKERYDFLTNQSADLNKAIKDLEQAITNLENIIKEQFDKSFDSIDKQFGQYFKILFNGGRASLSLVKEEIKEKEDEEDQDDEASQDDERQEKPQPEPEQKQSPLSKLHRPEKVITGIDIHATPPGKKLKGINMLSGGERALTSIALICAIIHNNPSPFVVLDEVDAALDESNSIRFASIIEKLSQKTQFVLITHNRATMEQAHTLYGVTMGDDGISKMLSINIEEAEKVINTY